MHSAQTASSYELRRDDYMISTDPARLDLEVIQAYLTRSCWAAGRSREQVARSLANSLCLGRYQGSPL